MSRPASTRSRQVCRHVQGLHHHLTKVVRTALQDAASVASLLITTEAMVAEVPKKGGAAAPAMPAAAWLMDF